MNGRFFILLPALAACLFAGAADKTRDPTASARAVIERFVKRADPKGVSKVELKLVPGGASERYSTHVANGRLTVTGNSPIALCRGFYSALKAQEKGVCGWAGSRFAAEPWSSKAEVEGATPFTYRYYFNVVTYGYSLPYWDWARWQEEIDYMALHGINTPLALVAQEAISARVFRRLGLSDEEISAYFVGPAHLPWMRMGNISGLDSPLPEAWHVRQIALQHKILARMRELGMHPICPGFAGFVPPGLKKIYPDLELVETKWCGGRFHNWMVMPNHPVFEKIGTMFIEEWEKEFGKNELYIIDSFNEMETPFPPHGSAERYALMNEYGAKVYKSLSNANPDAIWVMQGWMFGFQRGVWDQKTLAALLKNVPDDKMLLIDEAVDYNRHWWHSSVNWEFHKGFYNKPWIYSVIPNMGGKCGLTGVLDFYANGHLDALASPNRGRLVGHGMAPEGIENNQVVYELMADSAWRDKPLDVAAWLDNFSACRYGGHAPAIGEFWNLMRQSVYGSFTDHPRYNWQFRPGGAGKGSINTKPEFFEAIERFAACADSFRDSPLYRADLIEYAAASVGARVENLIVASEKAFNEGLVDEAKELEARIEKLMLAMDRLLESHPNFRLGRWLDFARKSGETEELKDYYERNARRIVTIWGPPVDDYSARIWSGLIRDYYLERRRLYNRGRFDPSQSVDLGKWEREWVEQKRGLSAVKPYPDPVKSATQLIAAAKKMAKVDLGDGRVKAVGSWSPDKISSAWKELRIPVEAGDLRSARAVRLTFTRGHDRLEIDSIRIEMDGKTVAKSAKKGFAGKPSEGNVLGFSITDPAIGNNGCSIVLKVRALGNGESYGTVDLLLK